jgi:hypothetical protein
MKTTDLTQVYRALLSLEPEALKEARRIVAHELQERNHGAYIKRQPVKYEHEQIYKQAGWLN